MKGMGTFTVPCRMFARPIFSLGSTEGTKSMCLAGDPICGGLLAKLADPTTQLLRGTGHVFTKYVEAAVAARRHLGSERRSERHESDEA